MNTHHKTYTVCACGFKLLPNSSDAPCPYTTHSLGGVYAGMVTLMLEW
jgi:hypothetical protein